MANMQSPGISRRRFLHFGLGTLAIGAGIWRATASTGNPSRSGQPIDIETFSAAGKSTGIVRITKLVKTDAEWQKQLPAMSYRVTREAGTEFPFHGQYWNNHADGLYRCICCDTALFDARTKFESGTGWPSFWQAISAHNVIKSQDDSLGMSRDAVSCALCDAHLGHVFDDGPKPTGLRFCMNSAALRFVPRG